MQIWEILLISFDSVANLYFWQAEDQTSLILISIFSWKRGSSYPKQCILLSIEKNVTLQFDKDNMYVNSKALQQGLE